MDKSQFPCCICDEVDICFDDHCLTKTEQTKPMYYKRDIGRWVVVQPDGKLCYYDETTGETIMRDADTEDIVLRRMKDTGLPYGELMRDTLAQIEHRPFRWEDVK